MVQSEIKKILIIRLSALGDTIHTLPAVYAIRKNYPNAQIDWVVEDKAAKFIKNNPLINNVFVVKRKNRSIFNFFQLIKTLRKEKYDVALDFQQLLKSGLILGFCGAKRRITLDCGRELSSLFANEIVKTGHELFDINYHVVYRNLDLALVLGGKKNEIKFVIPDFSKEYTEEVKNIIDKLDESKKTIVLAPATTWVNKHWTIDGWRYVIKEFKEECNIIITASLQDISLISKILEGMESDNVVNLAGKTTLSDLVYVYSKADIVISPDSGSAHVAWAAGAKSIITLFFATSANRTAPFSDRCLSVSATVDCAPCMKKHCKLYSDKNKCIKSIDPENVVMLMRSELR